MPAAALASASALAVTLLAGGIATTRHLRAAGVTDHALAKAVAAGDLTRVRRGYYAHETAPPEALVAVATGGRLAGLSAAQSFGLWGGWATPLHLSVPGHAGHVRGVSLPATRGVRLVDGTRAILHWSDDRRDTTWCWRVGVGRCMRQVLRWHDAETALAVVDTALTAGLLTAADLPGLVSAGASGTARAAATGRASGVREADLLRCRPGAQSGVESIARQRLERAGLEVRLQPRIPGVGHVDLGLVGTRIYVEVDGYEYHRSPQQFAEDRRRDAEARARGYVPLRFTAVQVRDEWAWVERMVLGAVAQSGGASAFRS